MRDLLSALHCGAGVARTRNALSSIGAAIARRIVGMTKAHEVQRVVDEAVRKAMENLTYDSSIATKQRSPRRRPAELGAVEE